MSHGENRRGVQCERPQCDAMTTHAIGECSGADKPDQRGEGITMKNPFTPGNTER